MVAAWAGLVKGDEMAVIDRQPTQLTHRIVSGLAIGLWVALAVVVVIKTARSEEPQHISALSRCVPEVVAGRQRLRPRYFCRRLPLWAILRHGDGPAGLAAVPGWRGNLGFDERRHRRLGDARADTAGFSGRTNTPGQEPGFGSSGFPKCPLSVFQPDESNGFVLVGFAGIAILDKRWWLAAFLLAIPVHIKVWPLAAALLLAACWPRRLAWRLPIAFVAVAALPLLVKSPPWVWEQARPMVSLSYRANADPP